MRGVVILWLGFKLHISAFQVPTWLILIIFSFVLRQVELPILLVIF